MPNNNDPRGRDKRKRSHGNGFRAGEASGSPMIGAIHPMAARGRLVMSPPTRPLVRGMQWTPPQAGNQSRHSNNFPSRRLSNTIWSPNNRSPQLANISPRHPINQFRQQAANSPRQLANNQPPRRVSDPPRRLHSTPGKSQSRHSIDSAKPSRKRTSWPSTPNGRKSSSGKDVQGGSSEVEVIKVVNGSTVDPKSREVVVLDESPAKRRKLGDTPSSSKSAQPASGGGLSEGEVADKDSSEEEEGEEKSEDDAPKVATSWKQWTPPSEYVEHVTEALNQHYTDNKQRDQYFEKKVKLRDAIQAIVMSNFGEGVLHLTGSSMSGFGTKNSDADMALVFDPHVSVIPKSKARKVIVRLAGSLRREAFCSNVETIFAKVPIIKLFDNISGCDVDININNLIGIKNSFLLRSISTLDERIPVFVIALKLWAKSWNINSAFHGTMSSYTLVNMVLYFLQIGLSPPLLPALKPYVDKLQGVNVNSQLQNYRPSEFIKFTVKNTEPVGALWVKFFYFWNKRFRQKKIFSVYSAKERLRNYNEHGLDIPSYAFVIEEPFQKDNIARSVQYNQFEEIKLRFSEMCRQMQGTVPFERMFGESKEERYDFGQGR